MREEDTASHKARRKIRNVDAVYSREADTAGHKGGSTSLLVATVAMMMAIMEGRRRKSAGRGDGRGTHGGGRRYVPRPEWSGPRRNAMVPHGSVGKTN